MGVLERYSAAFDVTLRYRQNKSHVSSAAVVE
ncbi:hypothetical protein ABIB17_001805 [Arthrobacter sp. UYEF6]